MLRVIFDAYYGIKGSFSQWTYQWQLNLNRHRTITTINDGLVKLLRKRLLSVNRLQVGNAISIIVLLMIWDRARLPTCLVTVMQFV